MKKQTKLAIKVLLSHLHELDAISNTEQGNTWKSAVRDTLNLYIGKDSAISNRLSELFFTREVDKSCPGPTGYYTITIFDETTKQNFQDLIQRAIKHVKTNGIYKGHSTKNFLSNFNNKEVISGLFITAGIIFSAGKFYSDINKKSEISEYKATIEETNKLHKVDSLKIDSLHKVLKLKQTIH
jgi:hypothetical protein